MPTVGDVARAGEIEDRDYDEYVARVDAGEQCPTCKRRGPISKAQALGVPLFHCGVCGAEWFDLFTQPTTGST
jgi:ribosomal protein L37AE/L43A